MVLVLFASVCTVLTYRTSTVAIDHSVIVRVQLPHHWVNDTSSQAGTWSETDSYGYPAPRWRVPDLYLVSDRSASADGWPDTLTSLTFFIDGRDLAPDVSTLHKDKIAEVCQLYVCAGTLECQGPGDSAHWRSADLPAGGHQKCPVMAN